MQNVRNLKNYQSVRDPEAFCAGLWYYMSFGHKYPGQTAHQNLQRHAPRQGDQSGIKDPSGWKFRERMFNTSNYRPKTLNRRNIAEILGGKKGKS